MRRQNPDYLLTIAAVVATLFGVIAVWDAGYAESAVQGQLIPRGLISQLGFAFLGGMAAWGISRVPPSTLRKCAWPAVLITMALLVGVLLIGKQVNGATRWYRFGPFSLQPSEFSKVTVVLWMAAGFAGLTQWVPKKTAGLRLWIGHWLIPKLVRAWPLIPVLVMVGLVEIQPDLKTAAVILVTAVFMMVAGGVSGKSLWTIGLTVVLLAGVLVVDKPYRLNRFMSHGDRWSETKIDSIGYQTTRSETALAAGGLTGVGFGQGRAKHSLPEPTNDFIMATIGEEIGLVGSLMVMGLLGLIVWRLYHQGVRRVDRFERLFLVGCATWIGVQTVANIVVANGAVPVMGVPLPFFSAGGSSLAALWIAIGAAQAIVMSPNVKVESGSASDSADPQPSMRRAAFLR